MKLYFHILKLIFALNAVLAHLGYNDKIPQTWWCKNSRNVFLTVLEAGSLRLGCLHGCILGEPSSWL